MPRLFVTRLRHGCWWALLVLSAVSLWPVTQGRTAGADCRIVRWAYAVLDEDSGSKKGEVFIEVTEQPEQYRWHEVRYFDGMKTDTFDVAFDPRTLLPVTYHRRMHTSKGDQDLRIEFEDRQLTAELARANGKGFTQSLQIPPGDVIVEPLLKAYLSRACESSASEGEVEMIGWMNDELRTFRLKWEVKGTETIEVPAGKFACYRLMVSSRSWYIRLVSQGQSVWLDNSGRHAIVRTPVRRSLFGDEMVMVMTDRQVTNCPTDPD